MSERPRGSMLSPTMAGAKPSPFDSSAAKSGNNSAIPSTVKCSPNCA